MSWSFLFGPKKRKGLERGGARSKPRREEPTADDVTIAAAARAKKNATADATALDPSLVGKRVLLRGGAFDQMWSEPGVTGMTGVVQGMDKASCTCVARLLLLL